MKEDRIIEDVPVDLDPSELLGLSQVAKVSKVLGKSDSLFRVLNKIGPEGAAPVDPLRLPLHSKLLSKIGEGPQAPVSVVARLLSKIGETG